jgi:hypothetical protein
VNGTEETRIDDCERCRTPGAGFWIPLLLGLSFGIGVCAGTILTVRADITKALAEQRKEFEAAAELAVNQAVGVELSKVFKTGEKE